LTRYIRRWSSRGSTTSGRRVGALGWIWACFNPQCRDRGYDESPGFLDCHRLPHPCSHQPHIRLVPICTAQKTSSVGGEPVTTFRGCEPGGARIRQRAGKAEQGLGHLACRLCRKRTRLSRVDRQISGRLFDSRWSEETLVAQAHCKAKSPSSSKHRAANEFHAKVGPF
jgi:hypothetical protein